MRRLWWSALVLGCLEAAEDRPSALVASASNSLASSVASTSANSSASTRASEVAGPPCPRHPARAVRFDVPTSPLARAELEDVGVDGRREDELISAAERATSDTLVLVKDGKVLVDRRWRDEPIETRSITKGLTALAVLALIDDCTIDSLDAPLSGFFPEFGEGERARITLRHVLSHTSGLRYSATDADSLNAQRDRTRYARGLSVTTAPDGGRAANVPGSPRVLSEAAVDRLFTPSERYAGYGLSFWLDPPWQQSRDALAATGLSEDLAGRLSDLDEVSFPSGEDYLVAVRERIGHGVALQLRELHRKRKGPLVAAPGLARSLIALGGPRTAAGSAPRHAPRRRATARAAARERPRRGSRHLPRDAGAAPSPGGPLHALSAGCPPPC